MGKNATLNMAAQSQEAPPSEWKSQSLIGKVSVSLQLPLEVPVAIDQGSTNLSLEVQSAAEFSSNPDQTHLPVIF